MKIAVCDDESNSREQIREILERIGGKDEIVLFSDGQELLEEDVLSYDLIYLDIELGEMTGLAVAETIRRRQSEGAKNIWGSFPLLVFVTGYKEHMPEAFGVHAFGYVVKPLKEDAFERLYREALTEYKKRESEKGYLFIRNGEKVQKILMKDILYIESSGRKNVIHTKKEEISYYGALNAVEEKLPPVFYRIHKGYIVNMKMIEQYNRSQMRLVDGSIILISKYRYADFVSAYLDFLR